MHYNVINKVIPCSLVKNRGLWTGVDFYKSHSIWHNVQNSTFFTFHPNMKNILFKILKPSVLLL